MVVAPLVTLGSRVFQQYGKAVDAVHEIGTITAAAPVGHGEPVVKFIGTVSMWWGRPPPNL